LTGEGAADGLDLSSPALLDLFSLVDLIDVLKGGFAARTSRASTAEADTWHDQRAADAELDTAHRGRSLDHLQYVLDPILDLEPVTTAAMKKAVAAGYWNMFRFDPRKKAEGANPFSLDSKPATADYKEFISGET